jgi:inosose dehydratase
MWDTKPENVSLCYELHWSYRASGNSAVSVYDHAKMYGNRSVEIHLRQSHDQVWTETFTAKDDIDTAHALSLLKKAGANFETIHIVLEQAPENGTPNTLSPLEIFRQSVQNVQMMLTDLE